MEILFEQPLGGLQTSEEAVRVSIGCHGRVHFFDLARQLDARGHLSQLCTGYPRFKVTGLPASKVSTFPWLMAPYMAAGRIGLGPHVQIYESLVMRIFDRWTARKVESCDVYHCLAGAGLRTHAILRERYGALSVCDRPCSHILFQEQILSEEYDRQGLSFPAFDPSVKERELAEYELCDLTVVPSTFALRTFTEEGAQSAKVRINPFGVDLATYKPVRKEDDIFRVIFTGQIGIRKGIPYLLQAVSELRLPNFELWLIGPALSEAVRLLSHYEGKYKYLGIIDRRRLHWFYSQGSVFVLPSVEDGFGLVQAEAMACGLPVIATTNTGASDLFTDGVEGFIVPIRDPEAIRDKVLLLYENPELRRKMSKAALLRVNRIGGWKDYGDRASRIYQEALHQRAKHSQDAPAA